jgi:hypothetical protein
MFGAFEARVEAAVASSHTQHKGGIGFGNFAVCDSRGKLERSLLESPKFVCIRRKRNLMPSGLKRRMLRGYLSRVQHAHRSKLVRYALWSHSRARRQAVDRHHIPDHGQIKPSGTLGRTSPMRSSMSRSCRARHSGRRSRYVETTIPNPGTRPLDT